MARNPEKFPERPEDKEKRMKGKMAGERGKGFGEIIEEKEKEPPRLEDDPRFKEILERKALEYLKTEDAQWFYSEYSGEIGPGGYLINKEGKETNFLPSQCLGKDYEKVKEAALREFTKQLEEDVEKLMEAKKAFEKPEKETK